MKAVLLFNEKIDVKGKLLPRDVRNIVMANISSQETADYLANKITQEKNSQSEVVYPMPNSNGFEILNYTNEFAHMSRLETELVGKEIKIGDKNVKIKKILWKEEEYQVPQLELNIYKTRTPIIISSNPIEHKMVYNAQNSGTIDNLLKKRIESITKLQVKQFFDHEIELDDLSIKIMESKHITVNPHKSKGSEKYYQAVYVTFMSNYKLPRFLGYQSGLGYGEIISQNFGNL